jgi:hypothetical protein
LTRTGKSDELRLSDSTKIKILTIAIPSSATYIWSCTLGLSHATFENLEGLESSQDQLLDISKPTFGGFFLNKSELATVM